MTCDNPALDETSPVLWRGLILNACGCGPAQEGGALPEAGTWIPRAENPEGGDTGRSPFLLRAWFLICKPKGYAGDYQVPSSPQLTVILL